MRDGRTLVKVVFHEKSNLAGPVLTWITANSYLCERETTVFPIEIQFGASFQRDDGLVPDQAAVIDFQADHAAFVITHEGRAAPHQQVGVTAQSQQWNTVVINPDASAIDNVQR